ncbi:unnamed protein product [Prunus armeniaca]|uniref:Uncharacterized protein n=1 Tax=Prunus armeniaca TaxID=36596 RepID=A0A6J5VZL2_PRUAR|nr:unnamed protein product [Prunus armeniaca]
MSFYGFSRLRHFDFGRSNLVSLLPFQQLLPFGEARIFRLWVPIVDSLRVTMASARRRCRSWLADSFQSTRGADGHVTGLLKRNIFFDGDEPILFGCLDQFGGWVRCRWPLCSFPSRVLNLPYCFEWLPSDDGLNI